jgi:predicted deacetylase
MPPSAPPIAVALHEIEPATFERCVEVRNWLDERGVDRVTLLVVPARDLHPLGERSPELVKWLIERRRLGDAIAQHGFQHEQLRRPQWSPRTLTPLRRPRAAEFLGLDGPDTRRAVDAGWRLLKLAGIEPDGFVAPAYAYTPALRLALRTRFRWWATLFGLHGGTDRPWRQLSPAWGPTSVRAGALLAGHALRLDLSPTCLRHPRPLRALERALLHSPPRRSAVTYDELAAAPSHAENTEASSAPTPGFAA